MSSKTIFHCVHNFVWNPGFCRSRFYFLPQKFLDLFLLFVISLNIFGFERSYKIKLQTHVLRPNLNATRPFSTPRHDSPLLLWNRPDQYLDFLDSIPTRFDSWHRIDNELQLSAIFHETSCSDHWQRPTYMSTSLSYYQLITSLLVSGHVGRHKDFYWLIKSTWRH